jgi:hypothetical protein
MDEHDANVGLLDECANITIPHESVSRRLLAPETSNALHGSPNSRSWAGDVTVGRCCSTENRSIAETCLARQLASVRLRREPLASSRPRAAEADPGMLFRRSAGGDVLDCVIAGGPLATVLRAEIEESWRRAIARGLRPDTVEPGIDTSFDDGTPLDQAADDVTATLGEDLAGTNTSVLVADARGRILRRCDADRAARDELDR